MIAQFASIITLAWTLPSTTRVGGQPSMLARVVDQPSMLARAFFGDTESIYKDADLVFAVLDKEAPVSLSNRNSPLTSRALDTPTR